MFINVLPLSALPPGPPPKCTSTKTIRALQSHGEIHALDDVCPCSGGPLGQAFCKAIFSSVPGMAAATIAAPASTISTVT